MQYTSDAKIFGSSSAAMAKVSPMHSQVGLQILYAIHIARKGAMVEEPRPFSGKCSALKMQPLRLNHITASKMRVFLELPA